MPIGLSKLAVEGSTYIVTAEFFDEDGAPMTPNAGLAWTLLDSGGHVINSRQNVSITPDTVIDIVIFGNDIPHVADGQLVIQVVGTYDSSLGNDLPLKDEVKFSVYELLDIVP